GLVLLGGSGRVGLADDDEAAVVAGHGAADQQQVVFGVDAHDLQVPHGDPGVAVLAGLLDALEDARRVGRGARGAGVAVHALHAVAGPQAAEAVPLDDAGVAAALARADDVDAGDLAE